MCQDQQQDSNVPSVVQDYLSMTKHRRKSVHVKTFPKWKAIARSDPQPQSKEPVMQQGEPPQQTRKVTPPNQARGEATTSELEPTDRSATMCSVACVAVALCHKYRFVGP